MPFFSKQEKHITYRPNKFSRPAAEDSWEKPIVHPMQRIAQGKLAFLKHVVPQQVDLALEYAKLDPMTAADYENVRLFLKGHSDILSKNTVSSKYRL